ncbi:hypothetical protein BCR44DRAFT_59159 [Catenaria anguillulae PL171]|uniref:Uncharacterized protein n=1 Tax=Catenaria anguillulae PL171 TaxID=765915 RepID=A0A1Y2HYV3_9FUNG|nr:hypothetical protein BCR44DRAFT_59159 [Catenaria anguillulae PL171]
MSASTSSTATPALNATPQPPAARPLPWKNNAEFRREVLSQVALIKTRNVNGQIVEVVDEPEFRDGKNAVLLQALDSLFVHRSATGATTHSTAPVLADDVYEVFAASPQHVKYAFLRVLFFRADAKALAYAIAVKRREISNVADLILPILDIIKAFLGKAPTEATLRSVQILLANGMFSLGLP